VDPAEPVEVDVDAGVARGAELERVGSGGAEPAGAGTGGVESGGTEPERVERGGAEPWDTASWGAEPARAASGDSPGWYARRCRRASGAAGAGAAGGAAGAGAAGGAAGAGAAGGAAGAGAAGCAAGAGPGGARTGGTGAAGDGGAAGAGTGTGAVSAVPGGAARPRPYYVPLLQQVLCLQPSPGPTPSLLSPPPILSQSLLQLASPLPGPSPYSGPTRGLTERRKPESRPVSPESCPASPESRSDLLVNTVRAGRRVPRQRPPPVPGTHSMTLRPSTAPQHVPLPSPPLSSLPDGPDPESDSLRAASPTVTRFLASAVTDPLFESTAASSLVTERVDFAAACRLDYATSLVAESASASVCPPSVRGECALRTDVLEDRQEEFECFSAAVPHLVSMLLAPEGDPDAPDIPTPRFYAEAIEGPYSSQWQAAMDAEMASWKSTGTYVEEVPPPGVNIVSGMWIFRVKRPPGSPPVFKARYVARGFSRRQGARREWHDTLRMTLASLGFAPSTADPSLFFRTDTTLPPSYVLVYVEDLVFATADTEALAHVKSELQKRHTCTDLGKLTSYLGLRITRDRAQRTITLTQSDMVQQVPQRFGFTYSSPQSTPLPTSHSLLAPPSDESVEPSGPYPELVGCLMYPMTCTRPDFAYPLSLLARYVALGRHRKPRPLSPLLHSVRDHFLSLDPTSLTVDLLEQRLLAAETSAIAVDVSVAEDVGAASTSAKHRSSKGKGGRGGGGGSGGGGGGSESGGGGSSGGSGSSGGGGGGGSGGRSGGSGGGGGGSGGSGGSGGGGTGGGRAGHRHGGPGGGQQQQQQQQHRRSESQSPQQLRECAEGDCYLCVPPDLGIAAAALGASEFGTLPGTAPAEALHTFTLDSGASRCFFRDSTTLTPLPAPVLVRLADPSGGPVVARSSTVLPCPAVLSGSLSGLHLPLFSTNLVSTAALQDAMVTTTTPRGQCVSICTCTRLGRHLATFTHQPGSSLYTLATEPPQVAASAQLSAPGQVAASCSCRLLSHQTLLWHHRLGHPSLPRLRGMHSRLLRAAPHFSSFPPTTAPLQTLHMDVWGPARISRQGRERYFFLVVEDYTRYTTVFPLRSKGEVVDVLIPWIRTVRLQLRERFGQNLPVLHPHSDKGGEFSSNLLWDLCRGKGILQSITLPDSPQQNGIAERRIGLVMEVARTSMIHAAAPHFLWPFAIRAAGSGGARTRGAGAPGTSGVGGAGVGDPTEPGASGAGGSCAGETGAGGAGAGGAGVGGSGAGRAGAGVVDPGAGGAGGTVQPRLYFVPLLQQVLGVPSSTGLTPPLLCQPPDQSQLPLQPASPLPAPSPYTEQSGGLTKRREPASFPVSPLRTARRTPCSRPPPVPGTHTMALHPSSVLLRVPLPAPPQSSLLEVPDPEFDRARAASSTVSRLLTTVITDLSFESAAASTLFGELLDFAASYRLDYATALVAESASASPPSVGGECALGTDVLEDRKEDFECLAAAVPRFASMLLAPEGDPDAPDILTPRSYAEAITGPYSSQWQAAMDAEMASWKSRGTYIDEVPPLGANIVDGKWIFRRDYELHSLDFSRAFLQGSMHKEIWLRRPPSFTESFLAGTERSLWRPVYGLRQAPREWHGTLRTTLAALGFAPATADPSLFLRTDTSLPPFYVLVYVDELVFATADIEALTLVKSKL
ncbi:unnamed protein product, partial [Closterium sp. NIES-54]